MKRGIFCFRRDHRLYDNLGLNDLASACAGGGVLPIFCLDPRQVDPRKNQYHSNLSVRFLLESLADLDSQIREACAKAKHPIVGLTVIAGRPEECIPALVKCLNSTRVSVAFNEDVSPFAKERDARLCNALRSEFDSSEGDDVAVAEGKNSSKRKNDNDDGDSKKAVTVEILTNPDDLTIVPVRSLRSGTGNVYKVFTPFCRTARLNGVADPVNRVPCQFISLPKSEIGNFSFEILDARTLIKLPRFKHVAEDEAVAEIKGGRAEGLKRITSDFLNSHCRAYQDDRDFPWQEKTTRLSAYFRFGCLSYREAHKAVMTLLPAHCAAAKEALTREFFWATFYYYITFHFPHVLAGQKGIFIQEEEEQQQNQNNKNNKNNNNNKTKNPVIIRNGDLCQDRQNYNSVWDYSDIARERFEAWKSGVTGFPIIDAGMRQLNSTGWMHNRVRMAVASFLTKDLHCDWRWGEQYFAQKLVDYEAGQNSGGWQWAASVGADAQPWFRIFNPWNQSTKHDCNGVYAKKFIPELKNVDPDDIHKWFDKKVRDKYKNDVLVSTYPAPIIDHALERVATLEVWKKASGGNGAGVGEAGGNKKAKTTKAKRNPVAAGTRRKRDDSSSSLSSSSRSSSSSSSSSEENEKPKNTANRKNNKK